jgi:hypothetical protein
MGERSKEREGEKVKEREGERERRKRERRERVRVDFCRFDRHHRFHKEGGREGGSCAYIDEHPLEQCDQVGRFSHLGDLAIWATFFSIGRNYLLLKIAQN